MAYSYMDVVSESRTTGLAYNLNHYYTNKVQISREDTKQSVQRTIPVIESVLKEINRMDSRFSAQMAAVGSAWMNLKVDRPDEFDVNVPLNMPKLPWVCGSIRKDKYYEIDPSDRTKVRSSSAHLPPPPTGYMRKSFDSEGGEPVEPSQYIPLSPREDAELQRFANSTEMTFQNDLVPVLVRTHFKNLLKEAVRNLNMREEVKVSRKEHGPALTIYLQQPKQQTISVDFSPVFRTGGWPSSTGWPRPNARWPPKDKTYSIKQKGVNCVAKRDLEWFRSYSESEKELVRDMDKDGGCRKKVHRIMKKLALDVWCPGPRPILSSYILKNIFFWECERFPDTADWHQDNIWIRFSTLTRRLRDALYSKQHLPHFFETEFNLLDGKDPEKLDEAMANIDRFLANPVQYLQ